MGSKFDKDHACGREALITGLVGILKFRRASLSLRAGWYIINAYWVGGLILVYAAIQT